MNKLGILIIASMTGLVWLCAADAEGKKQSNLLSAAVEKANLEAELYNKKMALKFRYKPKNEKERAAIIADIWHIKGHKSELNIFGEK